MKRVILATLVAGTFAVPAYPQTAPAPTEPAPLVFEGPIPVTDETSGGSFTPGSMVAGSAVGGFLLFIGLASFAAAISSF